MPSRQQRYDTVHMGRALMDLYSNDIGADFPDIRTFSAYVGGSPANMCVGASRLGLKTALLTAVGDDPIGDFIVNFLEKEGVATAFIPRKQGRRSSAAVLGIQPPDTFPLVYYRENCADTALDIDDVLAAPVGNCQVFQFAGTNLCLEPCRTATILAAEQARQAGASVILDADFRRDQWHDPRAFGVSIRSILHLVDIVLATEDELNAIMLTKPEQLTVTHCVSDTKVIGDVANAAHMVLTLGPEALIQKQGSRGATVHVMQKDGRAVSEQVPGFPAEVRNVLGAGDAFGAGFIYGYIHEWGWLKSARFGNACGAVVVMRHGCSSFMPTLAEVMSFADSHGGLDGAEEENIK